MNTLSCIYCLGLGFTVYIGTILSNIAVMLGFWLLGVLGLGLELRVKGHSPKFQVLVQSSTDLKVQLQA